MSARPPKAPLALPRLISAYVEATNRFDLEGLLATFADDALVNDQLCDYWGRPAIREWAARDIIGERLTMDVTEVIEHYGNVILMANVSGTYDKRGLPDPLVLAFYFTPHGNKIVQLIILQEMDRTSENKDPPVTAALLDTLRSTAVTLEPATTVGAERAISFGPFRLLPSRYLLLEGDKPVRLGSRACEILIALVERAGQLLSKQELIGRVWPDTFVEEGNLRVHLAALRRALGDGQAGRRYITNIPGRGYCFVAPVALDEEPPEAIAFPEAAVGQPDLPVSLVRMVGRADIVERLAPELPRHRFVTIVGPGGIGKTTVAVAVAERLRGSFKDGVRFVDLAALTDPLLVPSALAALLGVAVRSDNPLPNLIAALRERQLLIVLDNCEHVVEAAAALAEEIFKGTKGTHILATSREPLRAEGERVHRLSPLPVPSAGAGLKAAEALQFPAVQLFVERAAASAGAFELTDAEAPLVADICRRLDGIALAIEIVASRVDAFGVAGLAARLDDRFRLLQGGRRTAVPRHRTLSAALDWSYALLPEVERVVLRRLAVFAGAFGLNSATSVEADDLPHEAVDGVANLVAKSLVSVDVVIRIKYWLSRTAKMGLRLGTNDQRQKT